MAEGELAKREESNMTPGFGVAGQVMCPFSLMAPKMCMKQGCEMWVELNYGEKKVARCSLAWTAILLTEMRASIDRLEKKLK